MNEKVVDLGHEFIDAAIIVIPTPREGRKWLPSGSVRASFEGVIASSDPSPRCSSRIKTNETIDSHQKVPVATGTIVGLYLAVSQAEILLRVFEERPDVPSYPVGVNPPRSTC